MARSRVVLVDVAEIVVGEVELISPLPSRRHVPFALVVDGFFACAGEVTLGLPSLAVNA